MRSALPGNAARGAGVVLALALALGGCTATSSEHDAVMPASAGPATAPLVTSSPLETATSSATIPVYWLGHSGDAVYLYREFLPGAGHDDPIVSSLRAMMTQRPTDPDYFSVWSAPSRLAASISATNIITVDVSADAFAQKVDRGIAERSLAQLVYTATAAAAVAGLIDATSTVQVQVLVDGHTGFEAFNQLPLQEPLTRATGFVAPVWITEPSHGEQMAADTVDVSGYGASSSGELRWTLESADTAGGTLGSGIVGVAAGSNVMGAFGIDVPVGPGRYLLSVFLADPRDPARQIGVDTKVLTLSAP